MNAVEPALGACVAGRKRFARPRGPYPDQGFLVAGQARETAEFVVDEQQSGRFPLYVARTFRSRLAELREEQLIERWSVQLSGLLEPGEVRQIRESLFFRQAVCLAKARVILRK